MTSVAASSSPPRKTSESPVPSFTLQITRADAKQFLQASQALQATFQASSSSSSSSSPLHERLFAAAQQCPHPLVTGFLDRVAASKVDPLEARLGMLLFHAADKTAKLRYLFDTLSQSTQDHATLQRPQMVTLFRSVLLSLSSCVHTPEHNNVVVEGQPDASPPERPAKKFRSSDGTATTRPLSLESNRDLHQAAHSASFDSSLATLRDEDERLCQFATLQKEIEQVADFAADEVMHFHNESGNTEQTVDLSAFGNWYNRAGRTIVPWLELLQLSKWEKSAHGSKSNADTNNSNSNYNNTFNEQQQEAKPSLESPASLTDETDSQPILSFDFSDPANPPPLVVHITQDNILALRHLVKRTGLVQRQPEQISRTLIKLAPQRLVITRETFKTEYLRLFPANCYAELSSAEKTAFEQDLMEYFTAFQGLNESLQPNEVDLRELALGFGFFCAGNKSTKLALGFELLDVGKTGYLTQHQLLIYLKSYLSMLVATTFLSPMSKRKHRPRITEQRRKMMHAAVHRGATWTLSYYVKAHAQAGNGSQYTFDSFAEWYSLAGYNIAPWLELLDLGKVLPLVVDPSSPLRLPPLEDVPSTVRHSVARDRVSSLRRHHSGRRRGPPPEVLFTFPLANARSLVVLQEDATYVRDVVEQLGLLTVRPEQLWDAISASVKEKRHVPKNQTSNGPEYVDMQTFVQCVQEVCPKLSRKRSHPGEPLPVLAASTGEVLANFFQCFDLNQTDRVAIDELMGGLSLLCGGKKSTKLNFAFCIFDTRPGAHNKKKRKQMVNSLSGEDLFLFLRSILIITFSCCRQSLDMTDEMVGRCIADTANMICNDVMRYQWETKQMDRLDFDEFGQWYNDGGFERAPWLELLDLHKWVLVENFATMEKKVAPSTSVDSAAQPDLMKLQEDSSVPPPPPEDALDTSFFDENAIMPMDSMDEMDMILMQPSMDKETDIGSPVHRQQESRRGNALKFHLVTSDKDGGYMLSMSTARISHLRRIVEKSGIHTLEAEALCKEILGKASRGKLSKQSFLMAMQNVLPFLKKTGKETPDHKSLLNIFSDIFTSFDPQGTGRANAIEVACGLTVLCRGKKSDKLEFAFEVLDRNKRGQLSKEDTANYLQSFLSVLLAIAISPSLDHDEVDDTLSTIKGKATDRSMDTIVKVGKYGAEWAASLAFENLDRNAGSRKPSMTFDDFAAWYTAAGYSSIPWLELLDLQKWVLIPRL